MERKRLLAAIALGLAAVFVPATATAATVPSGEPGLQHEIDRMLHGRPGGRQISPNQVSWDDGAAVVTVSSPGSTADYMPCSYGHLCAWDETYGYGHRADFLRCVFWDVRTIGLSRIASYNNNQYTGTQAEFDGQYLNPETHRYGWYVQFTSTAWKLGEVNPYSNTYGVQVCRES
ncbi:hypothetical protein GCM10027258_24270 [Amycolatopsis stemonae]